VDVTRGAGHASAFPSTCFQPSGFMYPITITA